jgi:hypothetical protein
VSHWTDIENVVEKEDAILGKKSKEGNSIINM